MFELARGYRERGMAAYSELQEAEFAAERQAIRAIRHQREVGTGYFDAVAMALSGGEVLDDRDGGLDRGGAIPPPRDCQSGEKMERDGSHRPLGRQRELRPSIGNGFRAPGSACKGTVSGDGGRISRPPDSRRNGPFQPRGLLQGPFPRL